MPCFIQIVGFCAKKPNRRFYKAIVALAATAWLILSGMPGLRAQSTSAQQGAFTQESILKSLEQANTLMISKRSRSALDITCELLEQLEKEGRYDSPLGLKVRLVHGSALMETDTSRTALTFLLQLKETSKATKQWEVFAKTCVVIALELEYAKQSKESLSNLREAQATIQQYFLDSIYPHFAVRISSWHRMFGVRDSSIYYANEAVRTAQKFGKVFEEAAGQWLLGLNLAKTDPERAIHHYRIGAQLLLKIEEHTSFSTLHLNMARLNLERGNPSEAMTSIDSALLFYPLTRENNVGLLYRIYTLKGEAFRQMGRLDSAIYYLKEGHLKELEYHQSRNLEKIVEIDNKYNVAQQEKELETKNLQLEQEKKNRNWLAVIAALVLLFAGVLVFSFLRLRKANQITRKQSEQLKSLDIAKSRFFANVSHELRTPLTLLLGPIHTLLKENRLTGKQTQLLQMARRSGLQLEQLINEILDLRKLEMAKMTLDEKPTALLPFFRNYCAQFESLAERKQIDFSFEMRFDDGLVAKLDQTKCRQILYNLLSNAFKFTPEHGRISAEVSVKEGSLHLTVADSGPGIHPDDLPHVFDRFFQTTRPDRPVEGGTGIGLNLCLEYAHFLGGEIAVESTLGEGAVFRVAFPVSLLDRPPSPLPGHQLQAPAARHDLSDPLTADRQVAWIPNAALEKEHGQVPPEKSGGPKPTILVVEDNLELQDYLRLILSEKYHVVTAGHGQAALEMMNDELRRRNQKNGEQNIHHSSFIIPDLILSDLMMPVMDGYQLLEKLKSGDSTRHLPVIMLTARAEARDRLQALRIGVDDYLTKPFDEEELLVRIENLLKNQAARLQEIPADVAPGERVPLGSATDRAWLETFEAHVQQHFASDILTVSALARAFAMSESTLLRQLKRLTGLSPIQYMQEVRLGEAYQLLESRASDSIAEVASKVGYDDPRSFSRNFRARYGKLPSELLGA